MKFANSFTEGDIDSIPRMYGRTSMTLLQNVIGPLGDQTSRGKFSAPSHEIRTAIFGVLREVNMKSIFLNVMP